MLNATNLAFVTFARMHGDLDGPGDRALRDGRRRRRGRRRAGDHRGHLPHPPLGLGRRRQPAEVLRDGGRAHPDSSGGEPAVDVTPIAPRAEAVEPVPARRAWLLVALPLARRRGAAARRAPHRPLGALARASALSWAAFVWRRAACSSPCSAARRGARAATCTCSPGSPAGAFQLDAGLLLDPLSVTFVLLVTFVGSLIHVYSVAYMEHDADRRRFFAYLNLFVAAMLLLVLADSYLLLYVGWEGVGLASYLLIGFWNHNPTYAAAAKKAFVANRIGDLGLSIAIMIMFADVRRGVDFADVLRQRRRRPAEGTLTAIGLMLLLGRLRQVRAVPAAVLARRRDGRPDAGVRADPRRDHGHRRRLPRRPQRRRSSRARRPPSSSSSSSARSRCCSGRSSAAPRTTSRRRWPPRRCRRSAT